MATIGEVAARAGVGVGTVSRVINGRANVSLATRERVLRAIEELGYRPSTRARHLSTGRTQAIGVLAPFTFTSSVVERLRGVVAAIQGTEYGLVLHDVSGPAARRSAYERLLADDRVDGWLVMSLPPAEADVARLRAAGVPVVVVDVAGCDLPGLWIDDEEGGQLAAEHLLALGHRRVAFVGDEVARDAPFESSARRQAGFARALAAAGHPLEPGLVVRGRFGRAPAAALTERLLVGPARPTAVFAASDEQALGVLEAARLAGIDVPGDLSVLGFDDIELAHFAGLSTVRQPLRESGVRGARLLLHLLQEETERDAGAMAHVQLGLEVVQRATTARIQSPEEEET